MGRSCPYCTNEDDDGPHHLWECMHPRMVLVRTSFAAALDNLHLDITDMPACWKNHGIMMGMDFLRRARIGLGNFSWEPPQQLDAEAMAQFEAHTDGERIIMWTDGSTINMEDRRIRRAGYGIFINNGHPANHSAAVTGWEHTNGISELLGVLHAICISWAAILIRCDNELVVERTKMILENPNLRTACWDYPNLWEIMKSIFLV